LWVATVTGRTWILDNRNNIIKTILPEEIDAQIKPNFIQRVFVNSKPSFFTY